MLVLLLVVRVLLATVFVVAGLGKLADPKGSRESMDDFGVPHSLGPLLAFLLPLAELASAIALIPVASAWWGAAGVLALLVLFMAAIGVNLARGRRPNCHCFGQLHSAPVGWKTLVRNTVLSALAVLVLWQGPGASIGDWLGGLNRLELMVLVLAVACAGLAVFTVWSLLHLLRQNGRLMLRLEAIEAKAGIDPNAPEPPPGLPVDMPAPGFSLKALDGGEVTLESLVGRGVPVLLVFSEPDCSACEGLLPEIGQWQRKHAERLQTVLISSGPAEASRESALKYGLENLLLQTGREVSVAYQVAATPSGVLIVDGRIASQTAAGTDAIRGLAARTVLPTVVKGDAVPSIRVPDLDGESVDVGALRGRRSLLLFWNPSCGFCQSMLADLKAWEEHGPPDGPRLVVISKGSAEDNRLQGFRSTVLLDQASIGIHVFGIAGTPSGVMLDEEGRVASGIEVGAKAVMALANGVAIAQVQPGP